MGTPNDTDTTAPASSSTEPAEAAPTPPAAPTPASSADQVDSRPDVGPIEVHAKALQLRDWEFNALKAFHRWPIGKVLSTADFDAALTTLRTERFGY